MTLLHLLMVVVIAWQVVVLVNPLVYWQIGSVMWEDPEAHRPSDVGLAVHRVGAGVLIVLVFVGWVPTWDSGPSVEATDDTSTWQTDQREAPSRRELVDLTVNSTNGRILGYTTEDPQTLVVYSTLGSCMITIGSFGAQEDKETVTVAVSYSHHDDFCDDDGVDRAQEEIDLDAPLGRREVVDTDGTPLRRCEQTCE